ncbi:Uncharacterised protein [Salmonella enterica subsp. enterica]|uniref:Uncharacterized protein n=1 Tax=Salmonella enterica I TaxID=59201 RepID=A0A379WZ39_SALET|nr:Uncharacterised protein [Salmonella enterica subsp. enterica]
MSVALVGTFCQPVAQHLNDLNQHNQRHYGNNHHFGFVTVVAIANRQVAYPAPPTIPAIAE